jgi:mercuric reductase
MVEAAPPHPSSSFEEMIDVSDRYFRMTVQGMTCPSCERHVIRTLTEAGASEVTASYRRREARFRYDAHADRKPLIEAMREAGYRPGAAEEVHVMS